MERRVALERRVVRGRVEHAVDQVQRQVVADGDLLDQAERDQQEPLAALDRRRTEQRARELRQEIARPHDRAGDEVREERHEREVLEVARVRLEVRRYTSMT